MLLTLTTLPFLALLLVLVHFLGDNVSLLDIRLKVPLRHLSLLICAVELQEEVP